jgi:thiol-disulfide isomerase/thioredoxin
LPPRRRFRAADSAPRATQFYAPWCKHCQKFAPDWHQLEKKYDAHPSLVIGSVDCSPPSEGKQNKLCARHGVRGLPSLQFFEGGERKGTPYGGNRTADELLAFASELESTCSPDERSECTPAQLRLLQKFEKLKVAELRNWVKGMEELAARSAKGSQMDIDQLAEMYGDKIDRKTLRKMQSEQHESMGHMGSLADSAWNDRDELRLVKAMLRKKAPPSPPIKVKRKKKKRASKDEL